MKRTECRERIELSSSEIIALINGGRISDEEMDLEIEHACSEDALFLKLVEYMDSRIGGVVR